MLFVSMVTAEINPAQSPSLPQPPLSPSLSLSGGSSHGVASDIRGAYLQPAECLPSMCVCKRE